MGKCSHLRLFTNSKMWSYNATTLGIVDIANLTMTHSQNPVFQHLFILQWELVATNCNSAIVFSVQNRNHLRCKQQKAT